MAKWADYCILGVQYNREKTHIVKARVVKDNGDNFGAVVEWSRSQVVLEIERGNTFVTIVKDNGNWRKGQDVHTVTVNGVKYIRTDQNVRASDNLENLPEF